MSVVSEDIATGRAAPGWERYRSGGAGRELERWCLRVRDLSLCNGKLRAQVKKIEAQLSAGTIRFQKMLRARDKTIEFLRGRLEDAVNKFEARKTALSTLEVKSSQLLRILKLDEGVDMSTTEPLWDGGTDEFVIINAVETIISSCALEASNLTNIMEREKRARNNRKDNIRRLEETVKTEKQAWKRAELKGAKLESELKIQIGTVSILKSQLAEGSNVNQRRIQEMETDLSFREAKLIRNFVKKEKQAQDHIECKIRCLENTVEKEKQARERAVGAVSSLKKQLVEGKNEMQRLINKAAQAEVVASSRQEKITELQQTIDTIEGSEDREDEICLKFSSDAHSDAESGSGRESDVSGRKLGLTQMVSNLDNSMSGPAGRVEDLLSKARKGLEKHVNNYLCVYLRKSDAEVKNRNYNLCKKIYDLREKFPQKLIEAMHSLRDAGNAATHGRPVPNRTDAEFIMAEFTRLKILFDQKKNNDSHWY